jgi:hypothetical protein
VAAQLQAEDMQLQHVSWAELQQRCMHVAACVAAKYKPGEVLHFKRYYNVCLPGLQQHSGCHVCVAEQLQAEHMQLQQRCMHVAACVAAKYKPGVLSKCHISR